MATELVECPLPHTNPGHKLPAWAQRNGHLTFSIRTGSHKLERHSAILTAPLRAGTTAAIRSFAYFGYEIEEIRDGRGAGYPSIAVSVGLFSTARIRIEHSQKIVELAHR